ncbi:polysaccharide biosynthesis tyrosine autokinase [Opitutus sp. GAS368]|jgi:succinoglycan biosynthesis transport protein ExoP|uniref:GumC family protein n=1 Tax=Opitutus sp. GAS368 TaxID=1882749 RepID=UPI00087DDCBC|nr:polysaccharide biosynthesis tyrosine autokinase [Opitutus sp. GAS368]SDR85808.1 capsular exopolysaccharide family [Opitutus sp. GAS368]
MDTVPKAEKAQGSGEAYPYTYYGTSYSGYGSPGHGDNQMQRSMQDYVLILRERAWYIVLVFALVFSAATIFTFTRVPQYQSVASVQVFRRDPVVMQVQGVVDNEIRSAEDLNTQVKVLESFAIVQRVADRLTGEDLKAFLAPYQKSAASSPPSPAEIIFRERKIVPVRLSLVLQVQYAHPDRHVAAKVANLFIDEYIAYNSRLRIEDSMKAVDDLKERAEQQKKKVEELAINLQAYREKNKMVSLDQRKDIVTEKLKALNAYVTQTTSRLNEAEIRWRQVQERKATPAQLLDLPFISSSQLIGQLVQQVSAQKIVMSQLREHYRDKHPKMIEAVNSLAQTERELSRAIDSTAAMFEADFQTAKRNDEEARANLVRQESESLELDRYAVEYSNLVRDYDINEHLLNSILGRMRETSMSSTIETQSARVVDRAAPALKPFSPNIPLNLALGFLGGLALGTAFAFFVAYIDDRVKSSFDIESVVGLPLIGIVPEIKRLDQPEKAQIVANNQDKQVVESFLTLHSSLRLKDESKRAQAILVTSTIPGEGKSFTTTNLALTFAAHGEKVVIVDCDLRKPNIHKSFRLENLKGVIDVCAGTQTVDQVLCRNVHPNLDVIPAGGRAKNPTQILNSKNFELMLSELRKRYDRIFIDTPPLAAVSDALIILPLLDGSLFTIFFNRVRRKAAQFSARKLLEVNVPCFGAVLNGLNLAVSGYYYAQYYDKSYKDYYVTMAKQDPGTVER